MKNKQKYYRNLIAWCIKDIDMKGLLKTGQGEESHEVLINGEIAYVKVRDVGCREIRIDIEWGKVRCCAFYAIRKKEFIEGKNLSSLFNLKWDDKLLDLEVPKGITFNLTGKFISELIFL